MPSSASPIDIATGRQSSTSPRNHESNLTSQLQNHRNPQIDIHSDTAMDGMDDVQHFDPHPPEMANLLGTTPYGARQIPVGNGLRRESYGISNSLMNGASWGGVSVSSFLRDDVLMGESAIQFQSPSFHSSSYLPKLEANYMRDYQCCDIRLDSMHELLQHYEEAHAAQPTQTMGRTPKEQQFPSSRAANASNTAQAVQQQSQTSGIMSNRPGPVTMNSHASAVSPLFSGQSHDQIGSFDNLDDMDMDDGAPMSIPQPIQGVNFQPQPQFGRQQPRGPSVNVNIANAFQGQGLNSATPTTPHTSQQPFGFANPTVSSVNTPTLTTQTTTQQTATPDPSQPNTPGGELDPDFAVQTGNLDYGNLAQGNYDFGNVNNMNNGFGNKGFPSNTAFQNNGEIAKQVRESQLLKGLAGVGGFVGEEIKPFKCPVIGCEKAYKNQNGLKYHKQHGHQKQQLKENPDGTFSIVDPATSIPYPGTVGMEKEKPYRCETCGKRYKNLNGLKYHRQHSPPCNPELKNNPPGGPAMPSNLQNMNANVAGAGLVEGMGY